MRNGSLSGFRGVLAKSPVSFGSVPSKQVLPKTIQKHVDNLWVLGGEIIRDLNETPSLRKTRMDRLLSEAVSEDGGPLIHHGDSEGTKLAKLPTDSPGEAFYLMSVSAHRSRTSGKHSKISAHSSVGPRSRELYLEQEESRAGEFPGWAAGRPACLPDEGKSDLCKRA